MARWHITSLFATVHSGWHQWSWYVRCPSVMHESWESGEVIVARNYSMVQTLHSSMTMLTMTLKMDRNGCQWSQGDNKMMKKNPIGSHLQCFPLILDWSSHDSLLWLYRHSSMTHSSNIGMMTHFDCHPLSPYILLFPWWVKAFPLYLSAWLIFPVSHNPFPMAVHCTHQGCTSWLTLSTSFWQQPCHHIICLVAMRLPTCI